MSSTHGRQKYPGKTRLSISLRLPLLFLASFLLIIVVIVILVYLRFEKRMVDEYSAMGASATMLMAQEIDPDKVPMYLEENFEMEEYNAIRERLIFLKENYPDVMYMYIYHFVPEGGEVIFDLDSEYSLDADPPGTLYDPDPSVVPYMDDLCAGKEIPVLTGDTTDGYMLTYMRPVLDSKGNYSCHVCVDFEMEKLHQENLQFVTKTLLAMVLIMLMIGLFDIILMRKTVTGPIDCMKQTTDRFAYETESDHKENIRIMEELDIRTGDEIEDIYHLFITFMKNNLRYMENLHKAETDIRYKDEQIGQISQEAYRDTLTGVGSKTAYIHKVEELNRAISENDTPFAVVMVDMNDLKQINDVYGHKAGDLYIKGCCAMVCEVYKHSPVFRIGGDEFVVLLQGKDHEARNELLTTIRAAFAESCGKAELDPWLRYSASVGMAERTADDSQFETVFKRADEAMYEEKKKFKAVRGSYR